MRCGRLSVAAGCSRGNAGHLVEGGFQQVSLLSTLRSLDTARCKR